MRRAKRHGLRLNSNSCSTCEDLRRLKARIGAARGKAGNLHMAAGKTTGSAALQNLEETDACETWRTNGVAAA